MVKRKKISTVPEEHENGMTVKQGGGSGDEGVKKLSRKLEGCEEEESGEQGSEDRSTKRDGEEIPNPTPTGPSSSAPILSTSTPSLHAPCSDPQPQTSSTSVPQSQDQHHFLRSSVRPPSKRLRKDAIAAATNGHSGAKGKGAENGASVSVSCAQSGVPVGSASGASKSAPRNLGPSDKEEAGGSQKKVRRQWESWSTEDKNTFFEGLYEHGKDFEAIQNNIALKYKKKGKPASMVKNKEQVRHFYYRTWHKISKYIDFSNVYSRVLKKSSQELYGLICFAELRKKVGGLMDDKNAAKLNELIQHGATTVRSKGRNLRIKAPMCRALKKLCDPDGVSDEEDQKPVRLPLKVPVELQPRSNHSWARVQSLAHNPRLRMVVELHRKVSSLIEFLKQKWTVQDHRIRKSLEEQEALQGQEKPRWGEEREELFLYPAESSTLTPLPGVARVVHSKAFCTVHWLESGKCRPSAKDLPPAAQILGIQAAPRGPGKQGRAGGGETRRGEGPAAEGAEDAVAGGADDKNKSSSSPSQNTPPVPPATVPPGQGPTDSDPPRPEGQSGLGEGVGLRVTGGDLGVRDSQEKDPGLQVKGGLSTEPCLSPKKDLPASLRALGSPAPCGEERTTGVYLSPERPTAPTETLPLHPLAEGCAKEDGTPEPGGPDPPRGRVGCGAAGKEEAGGGAAAAGRPPQQIREEGWSVHSAENVTLAELYLMLGKPGKLQLEYEWQPVSWEDGRPQPCPRPHPATHRVLRCLLRLVSSEVNPKPVPELCSIATSPLKPPSEEQSLTPPGKTLTLGVRSPSCGRHQASLRGAKLLSPSAGSSGARNLPRSLLVPTGDADSGVFAIPTTLPPNSRHGKMFSPNKEAELAFRQQLDSISMQSDIFLPKQRKFRSRHLRKPLVVQRTLLPRTTGDTPQHVCSFSILSNSSAAALLPSASRPLLPKTTLLSSTPSNQLSSTIDLAAKSAGIIPGSPCRDLQGPTVESPLLTAEAVSAGSGGDRLHQDPVPIESTEVTLRNGVPPPSPSGDTNSLLSPPSVASLLDISLPGPPEEVLSQGEPATHISDSIIELAINSAHYGDTPTLSPAKLNGIDGSKNLPSPVSSPPRNWIASPTHDPQWYPSDSTDSSLGCLLSSLISPEKERKMLLTPSGPSSGTSLLGPSLLDSNSHDSFHSRGLADVGEVDSQLACMMNESSVDYIARFNDLAQELSVSEPPLPPPNHEGSG
ncbi:hypothetical protein MATL_G00214500 [Megalops atlanticus]|uniref:Protein cramped-like n=1 Tax=Megalops atlanticus TaxID=7932 RepID=A0A9D3PI89_MEGAT|nr:hypothetical protein MATL_G00214500 [Megalops atlanticus]